MTNLTENIQTGGGATRPEGYITKAELAQRVSKKLRTVDYWMSRGLIPYLKVGRTVLFKWSDVETHLRENFRVCRAGNGNSPTANGR